MKISDLIELPEDTPESRRHQRETNTINSHKIIAARVLGYLEVMKEQEGYIATDEWKDELALIIDEFKWRMDHGKRL